MLRRWMTLGLTVAWYIAPNCLQSVFQSPEEAPWLIISEWWLWIMGHTEPIKWQVSHLVVNLEMITRWSVHCMSAAYSCLLHLKPKCAISDALCMSSVTAQMYNKLSLYIGAAFLACMCCCLCVLHSHAPWLPTVHYQWLLHITMEYYNFYHTRWNGMWVLYAQRNWLRSCLHTVSSVMAHCVLLILSLLAYRGVQ